MKKVKTVKIQKTENGDGFIDLKEFSDFVDVSKVKYYELVNPTEKTLMIKFFDENKEEIKPNLEIR